MKPEDSPLDIRENVKQFYETKVKEQADSPRDICCCGQAPPPHVQAILPLINEEIKNNNRGCGSPFPIDLEGCTVLDLGSGAGHDCFILSHLVGQEGRVIGVDMTLAQLDIARRHTDSQMKAFGYQRSNVEFVDGYIEDLKSAGIEDNSIDVVVSNCVINLSPDKEQVFSEIHRVLKPGGELYFSDVFAGRRIPTELENDILAYGECLGGAMYKEDFRRMMQRVGFMDARVISECLIDLSDPELQKRTNLMDFYSTTVRAFKLDRLEDVCEDYGQSAMYLGTIPAMPDSFSLDDHHTFTTNIPLPVCGNTASMLGETRYARHFEVRGDRSVHYGIFFCGSEDSNAISACGRICC
jgi:arsenite methyltransferase